MSTQHTAARAPHLDHAEHAERALGRRDVAALGRGAVAGPQQEAGECYQ